MKWWMWVLLGMWIVVLVGLGCSPSTDVGDPDDPINRDTPDGLLMQTRMRTDMTRRFMTASNSSLQMTSPRSWGCRLNSLGGARPGTWFPR